MSNASDTHPKIAEIDALLSGATPQFSMQLKVRLHVLIDGLPDGDVARAYGEEQMRMLDRLALGTSRSDA